MAGIREIGFAAGRAWITCFVLIGRSYPSGVYNNAASFFPVSPSALSGPLFNVRGIEFWRRPYTSLRPHRRLRAIIRAGARPSRPYARARRGAPSAASCGESQTGRCTGFRRGPGGEERWTEELL